MVLVIVKASENVISYVHAKVLEYPDYLPE